MCSNNLMKDSRVDKLGSQPVENSFDWLTVTFLSFHTADYIESVVPLTLHVQGHQSNKAGDLVYNLVEHWNSLKTTTINLS